jgi:protein transport protein SEC31
MDIQAVHDFVVKVSIFLMAIGQNVTLEAEDSKLFSLYASRLADQGLLVTAAKYSKGDSPESMILRDRLYRSKSTAECLAAMGHVPPDFPFDYSDIQPSRGPTIDRAAQEAQRQAAAAQQAAYAAQQEELQRLQQERQAAAALSYDQGTQAAAPVADANALPPGWMALQDPASGQYYYANQTTGETTWDRPQMPIATPKPVPVPQPAQTHEQQLATSRSVTPNTAKKRLADKYGDGFVTSASHPELASQYGNVGTGNPYGTTSRPGTASVSSSQDTTPNRATVPDDGRIPELQADFVPIKECLTSLIDALKSADLSPVDKRLIGESEKALAIMVRRLAFQEISDDIAQQLLSMCGYLNAYDFRTATAVLTALVNSDWRDHKDWLKGTKSLLQLATKKYGQ